jgi:starch phosphorylase
MNDIATSRRDERTRTGLTKEDLKRAYIDNLFYLQGRFREVATDNDLYMAAAYTVRDRLLARWIKSAQTFKQTNARTVCYLSAEFLLGAAPGQQHDQPRHHRCAREAGRSWTWTSMQSSSRGRAGPRQRRLGRLAACYMDSLATCRSRPSATASATSSASSTR